MDRCVRLAPENGLVDLLHEHTAPTDRVDGDVLPEVAGRLQGNSLGRQNTGERGGDKVNLKKSKLARARGQA
jgi:hypothetical protein